MNKFILAIMTGGLLASCAIQRVEPPPAYTATMKVVTDTAPVLVQKFANPSCDQYPDGPRVALVWPDSFGEDITREPAVIPAGQKSVLTFTNVVAGTSGTAAGCTLSIEIDATPNANYRALYSIDQDQCALAILHEADTAAESERVEANYRKLDKPCYDDTRVPERVMAPTALNSQDVANG